MPHVVTRPGLLPPTVLAVLLAVVHGVNDALTAILGALLPTLRERLDLGPGALALLVATFAIASSASQPVLGALADRHGLRHFAAGGVALAAVTLSLVGPASSVAVLVVLLMLGGVGSAALHPIATSIAGASAGRNAGLAIGVFTAGGMIGFAIGPVLILALVAAYGPGSTAWLMIPGLLLSALLWRALPDYESHAVNGRRWFTQVALDRRVVTSTLAMSLAGLALLTFTSATPLWLVSTHGLAVDDPYLGWLLAAFSIAAGFGAVAGGFVAPRLGAARTSMVSLLAAGGALGAVIALPVGPVMLVAAAAAGFLLYMSTPLIILAAQTAVPNAPTTAAGVVFGGGSSLAGLLYLTLGSVQATVGLAFSIGVSAVLLAPAALLAAAASRWAHG